MGWSPEKKAPLKGRLWATAPGFAHFYPLPNTKHRQLTRLPVLCKKEREEKMKKFLLLMVLSYQRFFKYLSGQL